MGKEVLQLVNILKVCGHLRKAVTSCDFMPMDTDLPRQISFNSQTVSNDQRV